MKRTPQGQDSKYSVVFLSLKTQKTKPRISRKRIQWWKNFLKRLTTLHSTVLLIAYLQTRTLIEGQCSATSKLCFSPTETARKKLLRFNNKRNEWRSSVIVLIFEKQGRIQDPPQERSPTLWSQHMIFQKFPKIARNRGNFGSGTSLKICLWQG